MKHLRFFTLIFATAIVCFLTASPAFGQCVIPITNEQSYIEDFESQSLDCWTVEGDADWSILAGTGSTVVAFSYSNAGDEARLISPTFDMSGVSAATFSFTYAMMGLYESDELSVSYRTSETDAWHELGHFSFSDWSNYYEEFYTLPDISSTYQISFWARGLGGMYIFVDNIEIASAMGCARPVNLEATDITTSSALLSWSTSGNEESWNIELNGTNHTVTTQPYLMENLAAGRDYTFRVKANCGEGVESDWSMPITFTTMCDVITVTDDTPYFDDFEGSDVFVCWQNEIVAGTADWVVDPGYVNPNNTAFFIWLGEAARLVSVPMDITAVTHPALVFKRKQPQLSGAVDELSVYYRTFENEEWQFIETYGTATDNWETVTLELPNPSATYQICFWAVSFQAQGIYVDDVMVGNVEGEGIEESAAVVAAVTPNPTTGMVTVEANAANGDVVVFDMFGRKVMSALLFNGRTDLDLSGLPQGIYTARVATANGTTAVKLMKQ